MELIVVLGVCLLGLLIWLLRTHSKFGKYKKDRDYFTKRGKPRSLSGKRSGGKKVPLVVQPPEGSNLEPEVQYFTHTSPEMVKRAHEEEARLNALAISLPLRLKIGWAGVIALTLIILLLWYNLKF